MKTTLKLVIGNQMALLSLLASSAAVGKIVELHIVGNKGTLVLQGCNATALIDYLITGKSCIAAELKTAEAVA
jgi:hypothetical protein